MASFGFDPFSAFQVGQQIGQARSPVSALGTAVRNILDDARKRGLFQAQSQAQFEQGSALDLLKRSREEAERDLPQDVLVLGDQGMPDRTVTTTRGTEVRGPSREPALSLNTVIAEKVRESLGNSPLQGASTNIPSFATEADLNAALVAGTVKSGDRVIVGGVTGTAE